MASWPHGLMASGQRPLATGHSHSNKLGERGHLIYIGALGSALRGGGASLPPGLAVAQGPRAMVLSGGAWLVGDSSCSLLSLYRLELETIL